MKSLSLTKNFCGILCIVFCLAFTSTKINAQIIGFELNGNTGNEATVNSTTTDTNLNSSTLSRGAGITASSLGSAFSSTGFSGTTLSNAIATDQYLQFNVTPKSGFKVSLSTLDANFRRSSTGPTDFQWQYSLDGFATAGTNVGSQINFTSTTTNGVAQAQINLSTISALQNVAFPNVITFRLYGWNATATTGTFAIGRLTGNDLAVGGTTMEVTSAAGAIINGRITDSRGRGLQRVVVMMTGSGIEEPIYATTSAFGYYRFEDIPAGNSYILTASSIRYTFEQPTIVINVNGDLDGADFVGQRRLSGLTDVRKEAKPK